MSSRALPEDFDFSQTLQSPFGTGDSIASMSSHTPRTNTDFEPTADRPLSSSSLLHMPPNPLASSASRHPLLSYMGSQPPPMSPHISAFMPSGVPVEFPGVEGNPTAHRSLPTPPTGILINLPSQLHTPQPWAKSLPQRSPQNTLSSSFKDEITSQMVGGPSGNHASFQGFTAAIDPSIPSAHFNRTPNDQLGNACRCSQSFAIEDRTKLISLKILLTLCIMSLCPGAFLRIRLRSQAQPSLYTSLLASTPLRAQWPTIPSQTPPQYRTTI